NEKIYIVRLIRVALTAGEDRLKYNDELESMDYEGVTVDQEITKTAKVLSDELLVEKFVQGMFIVGIIGGFVNHSVYKKISKLASIKYKKRYLFMKLLDNN
ncbi:MAG: EcsC family protein, partial [Eubacteriales bacterium]|nr:EcsC family protein [Eubacteriales bacterium]